ncbi:MAG: BMP family ABC transporter substrate-binding protein [Anaerolineaceae bacterium]|nr:BMP family ABC transporter substrate-binding protein [Anaerolineaceae bacterium]
MKQRIALLLLVAVLVAPLLPVAAQDSLIESVCLVTDVGRVNDGTFNQFAYEGMLKAAEEFGLDSTFIETQSPTDYEANINACLNDNYDAVVTVGFFLADATLQFATENPDTYFIGVDQFVADGPENYVGLQFREDQSGFLAGALAAQMTESGVIAGVYGVDVPAVVKFRHGFEQGAAYVNPDVEVLGVYLSSFIDPALGSSAAAQFLGENADVIFGAGGPTGSGGIIFAACPADNCEGAAKVIGVDQDEYYSTFGAGETPGAENLISSAMKRVDSAVYVALEVLVGGGEGWQGGSNIIMSAENDGVGFAPAHDSDVPEEVTAVLEEILAGLKDGSIETGIDPVTGELLDMMPEATPESSG